MIVHDVVQRSPEWQALRLGRLTASRAHDMLATTRSKGEPAASRRNLLVQLMLERITGRSLDRDFVSPAMQQGIDREEAACELYQELTGRLVWPVGFVAHDTLMAGCSPDGRIGDFEGLVQVKCPIPATHLEYLRTGKVPLEYYRQIVAELWVTCAGWCDFVSYSVEFPEALRLKVVRVYATDDELVSFDAQVRVFLREVDLEVASVRSMCDTAGTLRAAVGAA